MKYDHNSKIQTYILNEFKGPSVVMVPIDTYGSVEFFLTLRGLRSNQKRLRNPALKRKIELWIKKSR